MKILKGLAVAVVAGFLVPAAIWAATSFSQMATPSVVCESGSVCNNYIAISGEKAFGSDAEDTTNWTAGEFTEDLTVGDDLAVTGDTTLTGTLAVTGAVTSSSLPNKSVVTMTNATTTPCAVRNTSGSSRTLVAIGVRETGSAARAGVVTAQAGTSTTAYAAISYTKFLNDSINRPSAGEVISTTSTLMSAYGTWKNNEWLVWKSSTSVHSGTCFASYY